MRGAGVANFVTGAGLTVAFGVLEAGSGAASAFAGASFGVPGAGGCIKWQIISNERVTCEKTLQNEVSFRRHEVEVTRRAAMFSTNRAPGGGKLASFGFLKRGTSQCSPQAGQIFPVPLEGRHVLLTELRLSAASPGDRGAKTSTSAFLRIQKCRS